MIESFAVIIAFFVGVVAFVWLLTAVGPGGLIMSGGFGSLAAYLLYTDDVIGAAVFGTLALFALMAGAAWS